MMKKNYFGKFMAIALMFAGLSLASCDENDNAIIDGNVYVKPEVQLVDGGAIVTANTISDVNRMLSRLNEEIKEAAEAGETFTININAPSLDATATENTISLLTPEDANIVVNFTNPISTDEPLVIESKGMANMWSQPSENEVEINFAAGTSNIDLNLFMPKSTVTLKGVTINELSAVTGWSTLIIEEGVTVNWLHRTWGGNVIVKDGGKILGAIANGWDQINVDGITLQDVFENEIPEKPKNEDYLRVKNLKFKKSESKNLTVNHFMINGTSEDAEEDVAEVKVIIEEGANVIYNGTYPDFKYYPIVNISGEGDNAKLYAQGHINDDGEDNVPDGALEAGTDLQVINKLSNLTIDLSTCLIYSNDDDEWKEAETEWANGITLPQSSENCNFKAHGFGFEGNNSNNITTNSASFKNCTFESIENEGEEDYQPSIGVGFPGQTEDRTSFDLSFDTCNFDQVFKFYTDFRGDWDEYEDYVGSITLDNTKMAGKAITKDTEIVGNVINAQKWDEEAEKWVYVTATYFVIDGTKYEPVWNENKDKWALAAAE